MGDELEEFLPWPILLRQRIRESGGDGDDDAALVGESANAVDLPGRSASTGRKCVSCTAEACDRASSSHQTTRPQLAHIACKHTNQVVTSGDQGAREAVSVYFPSSPNHQEMPFDRFLGEDIPARANGPELSQS